MDDDITLTAKNVAVLMEGPDLVMLGGNGESNVVLTGTAEEISELFPKGTAHTSVWCGNENCRES